jgi:hypothetical protein
MEIKDSFFVYCFVFLLMIYALFAYKTQPKYRKTEIDYTKYTMLTIPEINEIFRNYYRQKSEYLEQKKYLLQKYENQTIAWKDGKVLMSSFDDDDVIDEYEDQFLTVYVVKVKR